MALWVLDQFSAGRHRLGLGVIAYQSDTNANDDITGAVVFGANIAMETPMNDWLTFRGGIGTSRRPQVTNQTEAINQQIA